MHVVPCPAALLHGICRVTANPSKNTRLFCALSWRCPVPLFFPLLLVAALAPSPTPADTSGVVPAPELVPELELQWTAPPPCPDEGSVRGRIEQLLRRPLGSVADLDPLRVRATVRTEGEGWTMALTLGTAAGERTRTLAGPSCDTLAETAALLAAISLDPGVDPSAPPVAVTPRVSEPKPKPKPDPPPQPTPSEKPTSDAAPPLVTDPGLRGAVLIAGSGALGITPLIAPGLSGTVSILWPHARVQVRLDHWFARTVAVPGPDDAAASISMTTGEVRGCVVPTVAIVEFPLCAGVLAGRMRGVGEALATSTDARLPIVGLDLGPAIAVAPRALRGVVAFVLAVDVVLPLLRPGFVVDDLGLISRIAPVVGRATLGIEFRVPGIGPRGHTE